jgi:hypothetical protein
VHELRDLDGTATVRALVDSEGSPRLTLQSPHYIAEGCLIPAQSIHLEGIEAIAALHQVCEALIEAYAEASQLPGDPL